MVCIWTSKYSIELETLLYLLTRWHMPATGGSCSAEPFIQPYGLSLKETFGLNECYTKWIHEAEELYSMYILTSLFQWVKWSYFQLLYTIKSSRVMTGGSNHSTRLILQTKASFVFPQVFLYIGLLRLMYNQQPCNYTHQCALENAVVLQHLHQWPRGWHTTHIWGVGIILFIRCPRRPCESAVTRSVNDADHLAFS